MKSVENPSGFLFRPDIGTNQSGQRPAGPRKKTERTFFSILGREEAEASAVQEGPEMDARFQAELSSRLDEIHGLGQELLKRQSVETIRAYKEAVKRLLTAFLARGIKVEEQVSGRNILNQKKYTLIKIIDDKLEQLVLGLLQAQVKQIDLLSKLEEIQGLLVDVLH